MSNATFQVGANAGTNQTISFSIDSARSADLGTTDITNNVAVAATGNTAGSLAATAATAGVAGSSITVTVEVDSSLTSASTVSTSGTDIVLTVASFTAATTDTMTELAGLIDADGTAGALVNMTGTGTAASTASITLAGGLDAYTSGTRTVDALSVASREEASITIESIDAALSDVDTIRGGLGAIQNRFESTIANLNNVAENLSAARSRILDADIAMETSNMTKQNILQQAGVSILAQANQAPQLALSLLG